MTRARAKKILDIHPVEYFRSADRSSYHRNWTTDKRLHPFELRWCDNDEKVTFVEPLKQRIVGGNGLDSELFELPAFLPAMPAARVGQRAFFCQKEHLMPRLLAQDGEIDRHRTMHAWEKNIQPPILATEHRHHPQHMNATLVITH